jgi:hypothetical protein
LWASALSITGRSLKRVRVILPACLFHVREPDIDIEPAVADQAEKMIQF